MITIEEIPVERIDEFWEIHYRYLIDDEINCERENAIRFWSSIGFEEQGVDEYGMKLFIVL